MLTKTLKFDDDVLTIIQAMEWNESGTLGIITGGMMTDRKLYERTNKALMAMGGKWNRKAGGYVFDYDPRPQVSGLLENGSLTVERDGFFETPIKVIEKMVLLAELDAGYTVLEPSAGMGAIAKFVQDKCGCSVLCVEKNEKRAAALGSMGFAVEHMDFMDFTLPQKFDAVIMNPPFEELQDVDHVMHAYKFLIAGGVLVSVMSESPFFRSDKKSVAFRGWLESVGNCKTEMLSSGSFKESGTGVNARLVVIARKDNE